ncbi:hypothetical protein NDU88_001934 [Pleurodeles waltl]|uniref:Uncharacterized protein n=1 Tax=Pleurodeles waltl TaxID=8319 RepID=A0AAV7LCW8_PLEWA|nr:hypothetical protein NDU88_001934 [Pleurodeles waltl]
MSDDKVRRALALLEQAGRMDLIKPEALAPERPACQASAGVAVLACSPPRTATVGIQEGGEGGLREGWGGEALAGRVWEKPGGGRLVPELWGSPRGQGALLGSLVTRGGPTMGSRERPAQHAFPWGRGPGPAQRCGEAGTGVCAARRL